MCVSAGGFTSPSLSESTKETNKKVLGFHRLSSGADFFY